MKPQHSKSIFHFNVFLFFVIGGGQISQILQVLQLPWQVLLKVKIDFISLSFWKINKYTGYGKKLKYFSKFGYKSFSFLPGDLNQSILLKFDEIQSIQSNNTFIHVHWQQVN